MDQSNLALMLAELFFLDTEPDDLAFTRAAEMLKEQGWTREETYVFLLHDIAPVAGASLGYGIYLVMGEWAGFDREDFLSKLHAYQNRLGKNGLWERIKPWHNRRLLKSLGVDRLLDLL